MRLTPPKQTTFYISLVLAVLGFLGVIASIPVVSAYAFWFVLVAYVLLALGLVVKGL